jgi:threonine aldolase
MDTIDLRSDTVTHPTPAMREAMATAAVGDDVYGDDPTVNELEAYAADLLGKEAALFVTSGTQGNVVAMLTHCQRGDEIILGRVAHTFRYEAGAPAVLGGIHPNPLNVQRDGTLDLDEIEETIRADDVHQPRTTLICLENTQGGIGGVPITAEYTAQVGRLARKHGLKLHIDGARLFNAAAALRVQPRDLVAPADSIQICLSKGLCAPVGSLLVGSRDFIKRARRFRKMLGGGLRQAGVLAAPGLIALRDMRERLVDDHATAQQLAEGLEDIEGITVQLLYHPTNMVLFSIPPYVDNAEFVSAMKDYNIILRGGPNFRAVTHYWITPTRVEIVIEAVREFMAEKVQYQP